MKKNKKEILLWIISFLPLMFTLAIYPQLPDQIPTHWGFDGQVNDYSSKPIVFLLALMVPFFNGLFILLPKVDPKKANYAKFNDTYFIIRVMLVIFFGFFQVISLYASLHPESVIISHSIQIGVGIMLIILGNYMPKFKHNYFLGIRTPWTLSNEEVWRRTHRIGGISFVAAGICFMISPFLPSWLREGFGLVSFIILVFIPVIYSYLVFRQLEKDSLN